MIEKSSPELSQEQPDEKQPDPQQTSTQKPKKEYNMSEADKLLCESFEQPVRFVTYSGITDLIKVSTKTYRLVGYDTKRERVLYSKISILFAFPKAKMPALKPYIKIRAALKEQNLQPIQTRAERFHVDDALLAEATENASTVTLVTRAGYILKGHIQRFDEYVLYMDIGGETVIVYRHGLYDFAVEA